MDCTFPHPEPVEAQTTNRAGQPMCSRHTSVVVGTSVDDGTHDDRTENQ